MQPLRLVALVGAVSLPVTSHSQSCELPAVPDATITAAQDRDLMMCELGRTFPSLPRPEIFSLVQLQFYGAPIDPNIPIHWDVGAETSGVQVVGGTSDPYREKTFTGTVDISSYPALRNTPVVTATCRYPAATAVLLNRSVARRHSMSHSSRARWVGVGKSEVTSRPRTGRRSQLSPRAIPKKHLSHADAIGGCLKQ